MPTAPTAAERLRSVLLRPGDSALSTANAEDLAPTLHHLLPDGSIALLVEGRPPASQPAMLELIDQLNLTARQPVRALTWLTGLLETIPDAHQRELALQIAAERPHPGLLGIGHGATLLRLRLVSAILVDTHVATEVDADELAAARPDPFCLLEDAWLDHLESAHGEIIEGLARRLPSQLRDRALRVLAVDQYGISVRVATAPEASLDVRLPFPTAARNAAELGRAVRVLGSCPLHGGLRARHGAR